MLTNSPRRWGLQLTALALVILLLIPSAALAIKLRVLGNASAIFDDFDKPKISTDFRNYTNSSGTVDSSQSNYFGSTIASQSTQINRLASYHLVFGNTIGVGYTELPMEHTFTLANGNSYVRDLRINEIDLTLVMGSEKGSLTIGKGFLYGTSAKGDSLIVLLGYTPDEAKQFNQAIGFLPKLATLEVLLGYRDGKYKMSENAQDFGKTGIEQWKTDYKVFVFGLGARF